MITNAPAGSLTQGAIFSCALAEDYEGCSVHGLVITARCDITNDKAEVFNYVPVVEFDDWIAREGVRVVANRVARASMGELRNILQQLEFAPSILSTTAPREVLRVIFDAEDATSKVKGRRESFEKHCKRHEASTACLALTPPSDLARELIAAEKVETSKVIKELCQNAVAEAYFLPCVEPGEDCAGYVALLREIRHVPRALAAGIASGMDASAYKALCEADTRCGSRIYIPEDGFSWPTGVVQSPFVEHLMQRLTLLFSRIGVTDVSDETVKRLQARVPSPRGDK